MIIVDWTEMFTWKSGIDATSILLLVSSAVEWLPPIAAALSVIWIMIRIYETRTVQALLPKRFRLDTLDPSDD